MKNKKKFWVIGGLVAFVVCLSVALVLFAFNQKNPEPTEPQSNGQPVEHSICVQNDKGDPVENVAVYVYTDSERTELAWFNKTDADGKMTFTDVERDSYVAVLENVPTGYGVEEYYPLTGLETQIVLSVGKMTEEDLQSLTYKLGDLVMDFSVTAADGNVYTLSELLEEKQAVVLNFWYLNCEPCLMEMPYLQEAYAQYSDRVAVLAMNPIDKQEEVAAFQKEYGYTFPMGAVDEGWIKIMQLTAFPTTVVIDRYGNITLMHVGGIDNAQTFMDVFEYFCAEEYEQKLIKDIAEIESQKEEGTEDNPAELGGVTNFEVKVGAGKVYHLDLYKVTDMYLTIYSEDVYVIYNNKTYEPSNGVVSILLKCPDVNTPVRVGIGNKSDKEQTFKVYLNHKAGTFNNPYPMSLGEFTANVSAGNETGIYYLYTATEDGLLMMECLSSTPGVKYSYYLYNLNSYAMRNLEEDGQTNEEGKKIVSVQVKKGQQVQFSIGTLPDETNSYPAGSFKMLASFDNGVVVEDARPFNEEIDYVVTLIDQNGNPVVGASVHFAGTVIAQEATETLEAVTEEVDQYVLTDETGKAVLKHYPGTLETKIRIPDDYTLENTGYTLNKDASTVTVTLQKIEYKDYTVKVLAPTGEPVENVIFVVNGKVAYSDAQGTAVFHLPAGTYDVLVLGIPAEYNLLAKDYQVTAETPEMTATLNYAPGHETNPIEIRDQAKITIKALEAGVSRYYSVYGVGGTTLDMEMTNGYILVNGKKYEPQDIPGVDNEASKSVITVKLEQSNEPVSLAVVNTDTKTQNFTVNFQFPVGTKYNPEQIKARGSTAVLSGETESYCFFYPTAANITDGTFTVTVSNDTGTDYDIIVTNGDQTAKLSESDTENKVILSFVSNKRIQIQVVATKPLDEELSVTIRPSVTPRTGPTYTVTLVDPDGNPIPGVQMQFMQGGEAVGGTHITDSSGVVKTPLPSGSYTIELLDKTYEYDKTKAVVSSSKTSVTVQAVRTEEPVGEGMTRYNVMVTDYLGNVAGDYLLLFLKDGEPVAYNIVDNAGGVTSMELETGSYTIQLASLGENTYYYQQSSAVVTADAPNVTVKVATACKATPEEHWQLSQITPISLGGVYVSLQNDVNTYFSFTPTEQGVYRITVSDPNAVLSYWGSPTYPMDNTSELKDFEGTTFTVSVNTNALGQSHLIGIQGTTGCILSVIREGDAKEDIPYTVYTPKTTPVAQSLPSGLNFTYLDIKKPTGTYNLVYNPTDGYYHLGSASGPVMYVQLNYNAKEEAAPYVTLYEMVGGLGNNKGTALRCSYTDSEGNEIREDYTTCMLSYGACADETYGVYPVTEDLIYMIQMGGQYLGWWDAENANSQILFASGENLEIAWMFAFCYVA